MRNLTTILIAVVIVAVLAAYMFAFRVNYDEHAVKTFWETARQGDVITEPGLYPKWPWPINKIYRYPTRVQLLEQEFAQFQTSDGASVILRTYVTWRIVDPYQFFVALKDDATARDRLSRQMQNLLGLISQYRFDQLVNLDPDKLALDEIEAKCTAQLQREVASLDYGIEIVQVGISRLILPESTTQKVFERMRSTRQRLAASAQQEGENRATAITAEAERIKGQILSFATAEASKIRSEGLRSQAQMFDTFADNTELATFLRKVDTLKQMLPGSTLILDANSLQFLDLLTNQPAADAAAERGSASEAAGTPSAREAN